MVSQKSSNSITRSYVLSNERQAMINQVSKVNVPSVLANLVHLWTDNTSWNLTHHHLSRASRPRWSRPSLTKDGRVHLGGLVHLLLKMDEFTMERPVQPR